MERALDNSNNGPENIPVLSYAIVLVLSAWGGTVQFVRRVNRNKGIRFSFAELVGEICISCFVGIMIFLLCEAQHVNRIISAAMVGLSGHMGARVLYQLEIMVVRKFFGIGTRHEDSNIDRRSEN